MFILKKKIFSRIRRPISLKLGTYNPWVKIIQTCINKGPDTMGWGHLKILFSRTTEVEELIFFFTSKLSNIM
jgi:hypothetical protein